jgi:hypothetical protein
LDKLTSVQISEWEAYDKIDPIGTWRDDFRMAKIVATIQNIVLSLYYEKGTPEPKYISITDEMPDFSGEKQKASEEKQSVETMKSILLGIASVQNKKVERLNIKTPPPNKKKK